MRKSNYLYWVVVVLSVFSLTGCSIVSAFSPTVPPTEASSPTLTPTPILTPTPTKEPFYLKASVWDENLEIPILIFHQFVPNSSDTNAMKMRLAEFQDELQQFYDAGFTLISLSDWINGIVEVPEGRKPMILTMDDLWFGNQIYISDDGNPSKNSGIGVLWRFSQEHPEFGFKGALFAIYGDKYYPEREIGNNFWAADGVTYESKSWHIKLGNTIAWALNHGLEVYNHTLQHIPEFQIQGVPLTDAKVEEQLSLNDDLLRQFLRESGNEALIPNLENLIALPEGKWPLTESGKQVILNYINPEGKPVRAVMEAYNMDSAKFTPSLFSGKLDPNHIARITASRYLTNFIINNKDQVPTMASCQLGPMEESQAGDLGVVQTAIQTAVSTGACPEGVYNVNGSVFVARDGSVTLFKANTDTAVLAQTTQTATITP